MSLLSRAKARNKQQAESSDNDGLVGRAKARAIQAKGGSSTNWNAVGNGSASPIYNPNERSVSIIAKSEIAQKQARAKQSSRFEQRLNQSADAKADKILGKNTRPLKVVETPAQTAVREAMPDVAPVPKSTLGQDQKTQIGKIGDRLLQHPDDAEAKIAAANMDDESKQYLAQYIQGSQEIAEPSTRDDIIQGILSLPGLNLIPAVGKAGEAAIGAIEKGISNPVAKLAAKTGVRAVQGGIEGAAASEAASVPDAIEHPGEWIRAQPQIVGGGAIMGAAGRAILRPILESIEDAPKKIYDAKTRAILSDAVIKAEQGDNAASAERFDEGLNRIPEYKNLPEEQKSSLFNRIVDRLNNMTKSREAVTKIPESAEPEANTVPETPEVNAEPMQTGIAPEQVDTGTPHVSPSQGVVTPTKVIGNNIVAQTEEGKGLMIPKARWDGVPAHEVEQAQQESTAFEPDTQETQQAPQSPVNRRMGILSDWFNTLDEANADPTKFREVSHEVHRVWDTTNSKLQKYYDSEPALLEESTHYPEMTPEQQQAFTTKYDAFYEHRNNLENLVEQMQAHPVVQKLQAIDAEQAQQDAIKQAAADVNEQNRQAYQFGKPVQSDVPVFSKNDSTDVIGKTRLKGYDWNEVAGSLGMTKEQIGQIIQDNFPKNGSYDNRWYGNEVIGWRKPGEPSDFMTVEEAKVLSKALGLKINTKGAEPKAPVVTIKQTPAVTPESEVTNDTQNVEGLQGGQSLGKELEQVQPEQVAGGEEAPAGGILQTPEVEPTVTEFKVSPGDIDYHRAYVAHRNISMVPEDRAKSEQQSYADHITEVYNKLRQYVDTPEKLEELNAEMERYRDGYIKRLYRRLDADARTASPMITGPAKFPVERNRKRMETAHKRLEELLDYDKKAQAAMFRKFNPQAPKAISADEPDVLDQLHSKAAALEAKQERMKQINAAFRKAKGGKGWVDGLDLTEAEAKEVAENLQYWPGADAPFPGPALSNNRARIKQAKNRISGLERRNTVPATEIKFDGGKVVENADLNRVQIIFDDKPGADMRSNLKARGFHWSSREGAWQRQRTPRALADAREITGTTKFPTDAGSPNFADRVNSRVPEVDLPTPSLSIKYINGSIAQVPESKTEGPFEFDDPDLEENWKENSKPITSKGFLNKIVEVCHELPALATRTYKDIPRTGFYAEANEALRVLGHQKSVQNSEAVRLIHGILIDLEHDPAAFDLFNRRIVLADFAETAAEGMQLPGGWDADSVDAELKRVDEAIKGNSKIEDALKVRRGVLEQVTQGYVDANKAVGYDPSKNLKRKDYFRHMVLDKMNLKYAGTAGTGKRVGVKKGRGFLKARKGSDLDISYNYVQSEWEVLSQMLYDTQIAKALKRIQDNYDIKEDLKLGAARRNFSAILPHFEDIAKEMTESEDNTSGHKYTAEEAMRRMLNWKQSAAIDGLQKMALNDDLPAGRAGEYEDLLNELVDNYLHNRSIKSMMGEDWTPADRIELPEWAHNRLMQYMNYLLQEHGGEPGSGKAAMFFHGIREKKQYIKAALGDEYLDWRDLVSEVPAPGGGGYSIFQPDRGNVFYQTESIPEQLAGRIFEGIMDMGDVSPEQLHKVLALGGRKREWVLPDGITATLENMPRTRTDDPVLDFVAGKPLGLWKQYQLINPERAVKYNLRNLSGDIEPVIMMNPGILKYVPKAAHELYQMYRTSRLPQGTLKDWMDRGGEQGLLQAQEMGELNYLAVFSKLLNKNAGVLGIPKELFLKYWSTMRLATDYRESLLRYAAYLEYLDEIDNGKLKNYGGSKRTEVEGLRDPRDKAYKLANELLGAYDEISQLGRSIRKYVAPFWSWQEVNFGRTVRMFRNSLEDAPGAKARAGFTKAVFTALRLAKFAVMASALWSILSAWNYLHFSKEEESLPDDIRTKPHLIFGRDAKTGETLYLSRLGAVNDFTEWLGADTAPYDVQAYLNGDKSIMEILSDDAKKPVNKMAQAVNPWVKTYTELSTKVKLYPDIFNPQPYKDRGEYLADSFSLGDEYRKLTGKPNRPARENVERYFADVSDPEQSAYYDILRAKTDFLQKHGKGGDRGGYDNPKSNALWNYKRALRWSDVKAAKKFYKQYFKLGGTDRGIEQSFKMNDPLYGLGSNKPQEYDPTAEVQADNKPNLRKAFIHSLNKAQRKKLKLAIKYYNNLQHTRSKIETRGVAKSDSGR